MRIAFVTPEFPTEPYFSGGLASYLHRVGRALVEAGHAVHVVTRSEERPTRLALDGIEVHRVAAGPLAGAVRRLSRGRLAGAGADLDFSWRAARVLRGIERSVGLDLVQSANSRAVGLVSQWWLPVPQVTRVSCHRRSWNEAAELRRDLDRRAGEWLESLQLRQARHVFTPSVFAKALVERLEGIRVDRVVPSPFAVETRALDPRWLASGRVREPYLLFFGRLQLHKGFHVLARALPAFLEAHPEAQVVCAGLDLPSSLGPSLRAVAEELCGARANRLVFTGALRHEQLHPIVASARLVVLPSLIENLPNACLEAMAFGRPVVASRGVSFEELIRDGESGFLVEPGDPVALAEGLALAWSHPRRKEIGEAARAAARAFAPERTVPALLDYYREVVVAGDARRSAA